MSLEHIQSLLKESIGINPDSIGQETITRDINARMSLHGINDYGRYFSFLSSNPDEIKKLIEEVIVPETWFMRDKKPFDALSAFVKSEWRKKEPLNILSLPCSSGEEPYSIAITLLQSGMSATDFTITAMDISLNNILNAVDGKYTKNSFRGTDPLFREKYFTLTDNLYCLNDDIKNTVSFKNANIFELDILEHHSRYHVIFCRNLLIYFDRDTQSVAVSVLSNMLKDDGILFAGHAESSPYMKSWSGSSRFPNAFAFRKFDDSVPGSQTTAKKIRHVSRKTKPSGSQGITSSKTENVKPFKLTPVTQESPVSSAPPTPPFDVDNALLLANKGNLEEAAELCDQYIEKYGPDVGAFMVLALVRNADGNKEAAMDYLRKVIYLDPDHYDALVHLASLAEQSGKTEEATILRTRSERIKLKNKKHLTGI